MLGGRTAALVCVIMSGCMQASGVERAAFSAVPSRPLVRGAPRPSAAALRIRNAALRPRAPPGCAALRAAAGESDADVAVTYGGLAVREWREGDIPAIRSLLAAPGFDPEGPVDADCESAAALRTAYDVGDDGVFLVATAADAIVGTAALAVGTQVTTVASGASVSTPAETTGALRRTVVAASLGEEAERAVFEALMGEVERRAKLAGCSRLLALGYAPPAAAEPPAARRATLQVLRARGYMQGDPIPGTPATQFEKLLTLSSPPTALDMAVGADGGGARKAAKLLVGRGSGVLIVFSVLLTLVGALGVASMLGLDLSLANNDNRGPLPCPSHRALASL
jgi:hypothetical protein